MKRLAVVLLSAGVVSAMHSNAEAACGQVEVSKGDVKITSGQTKKVDAAAVGSKICSGDTITAGKDSRAKLKMDDGNELNISPESKIVLENYQFDPAQNRKKVLLNVLQGKIRAATQKENMYNDKSTDGQANTFQVKTKSAVAGVRGTDFLTGFDPKTSKSEIVTFKGKVEVGQPGPGGQILNPVSVTAGQRTEAFVGQPPAVPQTIPTRELEKANTETKAEPGPAASNGPAPGPVEAKGDDKKADAGPSGEEPKAGNGANNDKKPSSNAQEGSGNSRGGAGSGPDNGSGSSNAATPSANGGSGPGAAPGTRSPSSVGGSMLNDRDLGGGATFTDPALPGGAMNGVNIPIAAIPVAPVAPPVPVCEFCNIAIQNGPGRLNINVNIK